ncbi:hypothetical protein MKZ04_05110 [Bacillus sp. FSL W7-1354]|uniref:hypothetical protein n=1 Tax=Bacillus sp. FSL W7-1354 TaxID=2921597 RepID=UPI0030F8AD50
MVLKERGQIDQEFGAEEIADYLRLRGFKPKVDVMHFGDHSGGSVTFGTDSEDII